MLCDVLCQFGLVIATDTTTPGTSPSFANRSQKPWRPTLLNRPTPWRSGMQRSPNWSSSFLLCLVVFCCDVVCCASAVDLLLSFGRRTLDCVRCVRCVLCVLCVCVCLLWEFCAQSGGLPQNCARDRYRICYPRHLGPSSRQPYPSTVQSTRAAACLPSFLSACWRGLASQPRLWISRCGLWRVSAVWALTIVKGESR